MGGVSMGGLGGDGGTLTANSGSGPITLAATGVVNASGGAGTTGGIGANDSAAGVTTPVAVLFDADSSDTALAGGAILNAGTITADAGAGSSANGGDVQFDGNDGAGGPPLEGTQSRAASGAGLAGDFDPDVTVI
jgi:hypothetical protein